MFCFVCFNFSLRCSYLYLDEVKYLNNIIILCHLNDIKKTHLNDVTLTKFFFFLVDEGRVDRRAIIGPPLKRHL